MGFHRRSHKLLQQIQQQLNGEFTEVNLQEQLQNTTAPIVHLATHGQFSSTAEDTADVNKAEALRQAQLALIDSQDFNHPFYWSPFVLVGNWL